jgi:hypothetical protein
MPAHRTDRNTPFANSVAFAPGRHATLHAEQPRQLIIIAAPGTSATSITMSTINRPSQHEAPRLRDV